MEVQTRHSQLWELRVVQEAEVWQKSGWKCYLGGQYVVQRMAEKAVEVAVVRVVKAADIAER